MPESLGHGGQSEAVVVAEAPSGLVLFSSATPNLVGRPLSALAKRGEFRIFHANGRPYAPSEWQLIRSLATGEVIVGEEVFFVDAHGERVTYRVASYPVFDGGGTMVAAVAVARDVTADARVDQYLAYHASLLENVEDAVVGTDSDFRLTVWNRGAERLYGYPAAEVLGRSAREVASFVGDRSRSELERDLRERDRARTEITARRKDGTTVEVELISVAVRDQRGEVTGYLGIHRDISERKRGEDERDRRTRQQGLVAELGLRAFAAEHLQGVLDEVVATAALGLDASPVGIAELRPDDDELVLRAGVGWREGEIGSARGDVGRRSLVGYTFMTGKPVVSEDVQADPRFELSALVKPYGPVSATSVMVTGRAGPYGVLAAFSPVRRTFSADDVNFLQAVANVASAAVEHEQSEERIGSVRESERRRIARDLHDEVLQDLSGAQAQATGAGLDELAAALRRAGQRVRGAVYDLRLGVEDERSFRELLERLVELQGEMTSDLRIELSISDDVPDDILGMTGPAVLRVAGEALVNARRHAGAAVVRVEVWCSDHHICIRVSDDGCGFDARPERWGMGIQGMRERAELLDGELHVDSAPGAGTRILVSVPLPREHVAPERPSRVLLVEDHVAVREAIAAMFESEADFDVVHQAGTLAEARAGLEYVDVALVDLTLPDGYGGDLIRELRRVNPRAQALALSASVDRVELARAVESGAAGALDKTVSLDELLESVRRIRAGETLLPMDEVVDLLRFAGRTREREYEDRRAIDSLTRREREVLQLLADGLDSSAIAEHLHITVRTERNHVANILTKLGVHSRLQALVVALRYGIVEVR